MLNLLKNEKAIFISLITLIILMPLEHQILQTSLYNTLALFFIFSVIMYAAVNVAHHAEMLAEKYGEPYGTMILTMSAVIVEVLMIGIMMSHSENINLARDTIVSAVLLDINGLLGLAAIIGGIKHGEQNYNFDSTNSYISMIIVAMGIAMVLPMFVPEALEVTYLIFLTIMFILMFIIFTRIQIKEHSYFFQYDYKVHKKEEIQTHGHINGTYHAGVLILCIALIGFLSELMSLFMHESLSSSGLPLALGALAVAVISASPELLTAIKSAAANRMQTVINIALGASLSTVLLTIPAMIILALVTHHEINFILSPVQMILLGITFLVSIVHFSDGQSNMLEGAIHFIIFIVFIFFTFTGLIG
ncbi:MAG: calcium:proton antiporter [Methylophagaceae bacterium]